MTARAIADYVIGAAGGIGVNAYVNIAPERQPGSSYIVFAFRSAEALGIDGFAGPNVHTPRETVDLIMYQGGGTDADRALMAIDKLQEFLQALGRNLTSAGALETGVTETGYHYARRRITINPYI